MFPLPNVITLIQCFWVISLYFPDSKYCTLLYIGQVLISTSGKLQPMYIFWLGTIAGSQKGEEAHKFWAQPLWLSPATRTGMKRVGTRPECVNMCSWVLRPSKFRLGFSIYCETPRITWNSGYIPFNFYQQQATAYVFFWLGTIAIKVQCTK